MIRTTIIALLLITSGITGYGQNAGAVNSLIRARYLLSEKNYADALATLESLPANGAGQMKAALAMGTALSGLQRFGEANRWLMQVEGSDAAEADYILAKNFLKMNDRAMAIQYLGKHLGEPNHYPKRRILQDTDFSVLENDRDWIHLWQKDWYSEQEEKVAEGEYLIAQGQLDDAGTLINEGLALHPNDPSMLILQARIYFIQKDERRFHQVFEQAWKLTSGNVELQDEMLQLALDAQWFDKVNDITSEGLRNDPSNPDYLINRALARILDGKESSATKEISATEEAGIAPTELYYQAGRKLAEKFPFQAEQYLNRAIDTGIMDARFYFTRGQVRLNLEKTELAMEDFGMSLDIDPDQPDLYMSRAQVRYDRGDNEGACHDWNRALEMGNAKAADLLYKYCKLP